MFYESLYREVYMEDEFVHIWTILILNRVMNSCMISMQMDCIVL